MKLAPPWDQVENAGGTILPVAVYGRLRLLVNHENGSFNDETQKFTLERVAHVPGLGRHNLLSAKTLAKMLDALMHVYPAASVIQPRQGGKWLISKTHRPDNRVFDIKDRRCAITRQVLESPAPSKSLVGSEEVAT